MDTLSDSGVWEFHAKGNANILFKYTGSDPSYQRKLLRLRQSNQHFNTHEVFEYISSLPKDLTAFVIQSKIIKVDFMKVGCLNDGFGLIIPDLTDGFQLVKKEKYYAIFAKEDGYVLELKPKWLGLYHNGCRNCTMHLKKHNEEPTFCSWDLIQTESIDGCCGTIIGIPEASKALNEYFKSDGSILKHIQNLQKEIDFEKDSADEICYQMMLRDITLFITFNTDQIDCVQITDVDPKWSGKLGEWKTKEEKLKEKVVRHTR